MSHNVPAIEKFEGEMITEEMVAAAAKLFSQNYGIWGPLAAEKMGPFAKQGSRVKMSTKKLREQVLPAGAGHTNVYIRLLINKRLAGNVLATRWVHEGHKMIWITQLCVSKEFRNQGIAKQLLEALRTNELGVGILSSHPFAILAVLRVFGSGPEDVDLEMTQQHARAIMESCPVGYVQEAKLRGSLFQGAVGAVGDGAVSCADTGFWVDHEEPLRALEIVRGKGITWPFGELPDGHEFLVVVKARTGNPESRRT